MKFNIVKQCPVCRSRRILSDTERIVCKRCHYLWEKSYLIKSEQEVKNGDNNK